MSIWQPILRALNRYWEDKRFGGRTLWRPNLIRFCCSCNSFRRSASDTFHLSGAGEVLQYLSKTRTGKITYQNTVFLRLVRTVYQVPRWLHHVVCCVRVLGQNSLEAYLDRCLSLFRVVSYQLRLCYRLFSYLCRKMEIVFREDYLVDIIHLLRGSSRCFYVIAAIYEKKL